VKACEWDRSFFDKQFLTRMALNGEVPLIGFCGSPWTHHGF